VGDDLVPREPDGPVGLQLVEPSVELDLLRIAQGERARVAPERSPQLVEEIQLLIAAELIDIQCRGTHDENIA